MPFLSKEARVFQEIAESSQGILKKKELLEILLDYEELTENPSFNKALLKEEAKALTSLIDKICLAYFRALPGDEARSYVLELGRIVDRAFTRMIIAKYS